MTNFKCFLGFHKWHIQNIYDYYDSSGKKSKGFYLVIHECEKCFKEEREIIKGIGFFGVDEKADEQTFCFVRDEKATLPE